MNKLLAPNGKPSNLNAKQYKLVRTPAFKKWFGDFENQYKSTLIKIVDGKLIYDGVDVGIFEITKKSDRVEIDRLYIDKEFQKKGIGKACIQYLFNNYEIDLVELYPHPYTQSFWLNNGVVNVRKDGFFEIDNQKYSVSKVVDENGEPLVVYHGTLNKFNIFNTHFDNGTWHGKGAYFTSSLKDLKTNYITDENDIYLECFLNLKNPLIVGKKSESTYFEKKQREIILQQLRYYRFPRVNYAYENSFDSDILEKIVREEFSEQKSGELLNSIYRELEFSGIIFLSPNKLKGHTAPLKTKHFVAFKPNQIKLADGTNTTFDSDNPDIRFDNGGVVKTGLFAQIWGWFGIKF